MPSRLSSLLVRDGLIGVKRMERVFQRQVIYGGALDTILLEMGLVPEERLSQYLSLATGLPPATRAETEVFDANAIKICPEAMAKQFNIAPLAVEDGALRVLVRDPVDLDALEELANELEQAVQPLVVPEYRFHVVFDRAYGRDTEARYAALAKKAAEVAPSPPVGKPQTVIIEGDRRSDEEVADHVVVDVALPPSSAPSASRTNTMDLSTDALAKHLEETEEKRKDAESRRAGTADVVEAVPEAPMQVPDTPLPEPRREAPEPVAQHDVDATAPLTAQEAREALETAQDRDIIFSILLRAVRGKAFYAGLLTIQGRAAIGRIAIAGGEIDRDGITQVLIPVDEASAFSQAVTSASPYIGPIATNDDEIDSMLERMGGVVPPAALLLPIALRNRVVALVVGHRGAETIGAADLAELLPLASAAADALSRLIMRAKSVGYRQAKGGDDAAPKVELDELPTKKTQKKEQGWATPTAEAAVEPAPDLEFGSEVSMEAGEPEPIGKVLDIVEGDDEAAAKDAMSEAAQRGEETLEALGDRFPGKLTVDRYELGGRILQAAEHGPILALVIELGAATGDVLVQMMKDTNRETRYYATLCASEIRPRSALTPLVERLFDQDYGIRSVAIDALRGYPTRELDKAMEYARHAIHSEDAGRVQAASDAVAELADIKAIPDLLDANQRNDDGSPYARRALVALSKQTFGSSNRKWRNWWNKHKKSHRIEWLMEGLGHKDETVRRSAAEDLRKITGEYFGFHHDLSKKEREQARQRWVQWWSETGRRRFLRKERDERQRPTAVLPVRQD